MATLRDEGQAILVPSQRTTLLPLLAEQVLNSLNVQVEAMAIVRIGNDAALYVPGVPELKLLYVLDGALHVSVEGCEELVAPMGSILVLPKNLARSFSTQEAPTRRFDVDEVIYRAGPRGPFYFDAFEGASPATTTLVWRISVDLSPGFDAFDGLVQPLCVNLGMSSFVRGAFETMIEALQRRGTGTATLVNTLMKACLVEALRHGLDRPVNPGRSPAIFVKPWLARSITAVLSDPASAHSVASLAKAAGMSRSGFAKAFEETMDATPMEFVARARLARAHELLATTDDSIAAIAASVGFSSRSHFSARFRDRYGDDPTTFRRKIQLKGHGRPDCAIANAPGYWEWASERTRYRPPFMRPECFSASA